MTAVQYYFAYGSNMNPERVRRREMRFEDHHAGLLADYRLVFNKRSVKYPGAASANVMASVGAVTEGIVYRLSQPAQIETMDAFEGFPVRYGRLSLPVNCQHGTVDAWVYIANNDYITEGLKPARWYLDHLLVAAPHLSAGYVKKLASFACLDDSAVEPR